MQVLLERALKSSDEVAADLSMLSADERNQLVSGFNSTDTPMPADKTLSQLFEAQAAAKPQNTCLVEGSKRLLYAEVISLPHHQLSVDCMHDAFLLVDQDLGLEARACVLLTHQHHPW